VISALASISSAFVIGRVWILHSRTGPSRWKDSRTLSGRARNSENRCPVSFVCQRREATTAIPPVDAVESDPLQFTITVAFGCFCLGNCTLDMVNFK
jgi:hypothetical protein